MTEEPDWTAYERLGLRAFPTMGVHPDGSCRCSSGAGCNSIGKHPKYRGWWETAGTVEAYERWSPGDSISVATGRGVAVLDWDGIPPMRRPNTLCTQTPSGGEHWYFRTDRRVRNGVKVFDGILDIRGEGGFVVAPPSLHRTLRRYEWLLYVPLARPTQFASSVMVTQRPRREQPELVWPTEEPEEESVLWDDLCATFIDEMVDAASGTRNQTLYRTACRVIEMICDGVVFRDRLRDLAEAAVISGLDHSEVRRTIRSAMSALAGVSEAK